MSDHVRATLRIRGIVQGVFYRASTDAEARRLGLVGTVRNEYDGSVSAVAEGPRAQIEQLIAWCRQGPTSAKVDAVDVEWGDATGEFSDFRVGF